MTDTELIGGEEMPNNLRAALQAQQDAGTTETHNPYPNGWKNENWRRGYNDERFIGQKQSLAFAVYKEGASARRAIGKAKDALAHHAIVGLGRITNEDDGVVTLQFKNEDAAQRFMESYTPTVDVRDMPAIPEDAPAPATLMCRLFRLFRLNQEN